MPTANLHHHPAIPLLLLLLAVLLTYGNTLDVPFYLDDFSSIQENPVIYEWQGTLKELWQFSAMRVVGYLSFALNYQAHQFQVSGYHIVNILIHLLAGIAVWALVRGLLQTPAVRDQVDPTTLYWLPVLASLIYVLHPLQIQAVTYIVQRLASLAALFYLSALACYVQTRLTNGITGRIAWSLCCLLLMLLAFFTKQNTATLPAAILLIELIFFPGHLKRLLLTTAAASFVAMLLWMAVALVFKQNPFSLHAMQALTRETTEISREIYLITQFSVLWHYISLFFFPVGLHIDYDYPIANSIWQFKPLIALTGHLLMIGAAFWLLRRQPLIAFGILFYYLAHAVESSVIPITDVIFEHRTYLPNFGLCLMCSWLLLEPLRQVGGLKTALIASIVLVLALGVMTWQRNQVWRNPIALWQDNVEQSPSKLRGWIILGKHLIQSGRPSDGLRALEKSVATITKADGSQIKTYTVETMLNMVVAYRMLKRHDEALALIEKALNSDLQPSDQAKFYINKGNILYEQQRYQETEQSYRTAIELYPQSLIARANLASVFAATGRFDQAMQLYQEILAIDPANETVKANMQAIRAAMQQHD